VSTPSGAAPREPLRCGDCHRDRSSAESVRRGHAGCCSARLLRALLRLRHRLARCCGRDAARFRRAAVDSELAVCPAPARGSAARQWASVTRPAPARS